MCFIAQIVASRTRRRRGEPLEGGGSWDPDGLRGEEGGRVYSTAHAIFALRAEYRFVPTLDAGWRSKR